MNIIIHRLAPAILLSLSLTAHAQWVHYGQQRFGKVSFELYAKKGSWGLGQQFYGANFSNGIFYDLHVTGVLYAKLTCGNEVTSNFDFKVDKYGSKIRVNVEGDTDNQADGFLVEATGLLASADEEKCKGVEIVINGYKNYSRIQALGIRDLKLKAVQSDGSEVPVSFSGELSNTSPSQSTIPTAQPAPGSTANPQTPGSNPGYQPPRDVTAERQQEEERRKQEQQENTRRQLEAQRQQQLERINEANRRSGELNQTLFSTLGNVADLIMQNMFRKSIQGENQQRQGQFDRLQQLVSTRNGTLTNCTHCYGQGYTSCDGCSGGGTKSCTACFGRGTSSCTLCAGTGYFLSRTCGSCGGKGSFQCAICKGSGNSYCTDCHATGKEFCYYCTGTGQVFEESYTDTPATRPNYTAPAPTPAYTAPSTNTYPYSGAKYNVQSYTLNLTSDWLSERYNDKQNDYYITHIFHNNGNPGSVASTNTGFNGQMNRYVGETTLKDTLEKYFARQFYLTEASGNPYSAWRLVLSKNTGYGKQQVFWRPDFPESEIKKYMLEGYQITTVATNNKSWLIVMSTNSDMSEQTWKQSETFPGAFIKEKWDQGLSITDVDYKDGQFLVVMSKSRSIGYQFYQTDFEFPESIIAEKMKEGYRISSIAKNGIWVVVMSTFKTR